MIHAIAIPRRRGPAVDDIGGTLRASSNDQLPAGAGGIYRRVKMIGRSAGMKVVADTIQKVSQANGNVLISAESGTGKELVARAIHARSIRAGQPLVAINCAAIPTDLMESEVFGHEKGAFSGAHRRFPGKFAHAAGGTVFLDEISCMALPLQAKLLRFLQDRQVTPIGGVHANRIDIRIIAATNSCLEDLVAKGQFRKDLYFRLNVLPISIPPLRHRRGDIRLLIDHFLGRLTAGFQRKPKGFTSRALEILEAYNWPGNVRELENLIERLVVLRGDKRLLDENDLPQELATSTMAAARSAPAQFGGLGLQGARREFERHYIVNALKDCGWNQSKAARQMKIHRNTLIQKIRTLNIAPRRHGLSAD